MSELEVKYKLENGNKITIKAQHKNCDHLKEIINDYLKQNFYL